MKKRKSTRKRSQVVESMAAAASMAGCDIAIVKRAKKMGCLAFMTGNRIDVAVLQKWIGENAAELSAPAVLELRDWKINEEIRKLRLMNDQKEKMLVSKAKGADVIRQILESVTITLEQRLENEYPSMVAGLDISQARIYGKRLADLIREDFRKLSVLWLKL